MLRNFRFLDHAEHCVAPQDHAWESIFPIGQSIADFPGCVS